MIKVCQRATRRLATTMAIASKVLSIRRSFALNCLHFIDKHEVKGARASYALYTLHYLVVVRLLIILAIA